MAFPPAVVADADALFGATTRGLLIQLDCAGLLPPRTMVDVVTAQAQYEVVSNAALTPNGPNLT